MKKRYMILAALLAAAVTCAGCGKKEKPHSDALVTETPEPEENQGALVDMQQTSKDEYSDITKIIGTKTETASKMVITNQIGGEIADIYIRPNCDDDDEEWGTELIKGAFTLKNGEKALYYYDPNQKDKDGKMVTSYDIRISFTDEERNECFFRNLPLTTIKEITLRMDGSGEDGIPYATFTTGNSKKEYSTLKAVKKRLGLLDDDDDEEDAEDETDSTDTPSVTPTAAPSRNNVTPTPTPAGGIDWGGEDDPEISTAPDPGADKAKGYIGQSLDALIDGCGSPTMSEYQEEPETGKTGYHYYDTFTVSTTVDENGNEIVAGVW